MKVANKENQFLGNVLYKVDINCMKVCFGQINTKELELGKKTGEHY